MGWKIINGRRYYYKSEREGGRVKTTYFGAGESGLLISRLESVERAEREAERDERRAETDETRAQEKGGADWFNGVQVVADEAIIAGGFHKHKAMRRSAVCPQSRGDHVGPGRSGATGSVGSCRSAVSWPVGIDRLISIERWLIWPSSASPGSRPIVGWIHWNGPSWFRRSDSRAGLRK